MMETVVERFWRRIFLTLFTMEVLAVVFLGLMGATTGRESDRARGVNRALVEEMQLTDLALWSGASYCRHPSQADWFAPHGDHPGALEHFPAGSWVPPPLTGHPGSQLELGEP